MARRGFTVISACNPNYSCPIDSRGPGLSIALFIVVGLLSPCRYEVFAHRIVGIIMRHQEAEAGIIIPGHHVTYIARVTTASVTGRVTAECTLSASGGPAVACISVQTIDVT